MHRALSHFNETCAQGLIPGQCNRLLVSPPRPARQRVPWVLSLWKGPTMLRARTHLTHNTMKSAALDCCYCCFHLLVSNLSLQLHNAKTFTLIKMSPNHINNGEGMKLFRRSYFSSIHSAISGEYVLRSNVLDYFLCLRL